MEKRFDSASIEQEIFCKSNRQEEKVFKVQSHGV